MNASISPFPFLVFIDKNKYFINKFINNQIFKIKI